MFASSGRLTQRRAFVWHHGTKYIQWMIEKRLEQRPGSGPRTNQAPRPPEPTPSRNTLNAQRNTVDKPSKSTRQTLIFAGYMVLEVAQEVQNLGVLLR